MTANTRGDNRDDDPSGDDCLNNANPSSPASLFVPELVAKAPGPVRWVLKKMYCPLLTPNDTPRERLLKTFVFITVPLQGAPILNLGLTVSTAIASGQPTVASYAEGSAMTLMIIAWAAIYLHVRITRTVSDWSADLANLSTWIGVTSVAITNLDAPMSIAAIYGLNIMLIALTPRTFLLGVLYSITFCIASYNFVIADENRGAIHHAAEGTNKWSLPLLTLPGALDRGLLVRFIFCGIYYVPLIAISIGLSLRMASADALSRKAVASAALAAKISRALARYDTDAATAALQIAVAGGECDDALSKHFTALIGNLDRYRPHLPNWLVVQTESDDQTANVDAKDIEDDDEDLDLNGEISFNASASADLARSLTPSAASDGRSASGTSSTQNNRRGSLDASSNGGGIGGGGGQHHRHESFGSAHPATVSLACVDFVMPANRALAGLQAHFNAIVDHVHELARKSYGAVHSFVGDRVTVSWNAASNVANPQAKAARFLAQVNSAARDNVLGNGVRVSGATASGRAAVHVAGLGAQRALVLHARGAWGTVLEALRAEAWRQGGGTMLADDRTKREAEHAVSMSAQAAISVLLAPTLSSTLGDSHRDAPAFLWAPGTPNASTQQQQTVSPRTPTTTHQRQPISIGAVGHRSPLNASAGRRRTAESERLGLVRVVGYAVTGLRDEGTDEWMYVLKNRESREADALRTDLLQKWEQRDCSALDCTSALTPPPLRTVAQMANSSFYSTSEADSRLRALLDSFSLAHAIEQSAAEVAQRRQQQQQQFLLLNGHLRPGNRDEVSDADAIRDSAVSVESVGRRDCD